MGAPTSPATAALCPTCFQSGRIKGELNVSAYELKDVIHLWDVGKLTEEQAIGQSLLLLQGLQERMEELERRELERGREGESAS